VFYAVVGVQVAVIIFGLPLTKAVLINPDYHSAKELQEAEKTLGIKTYEMSSFTPEIVWDYGYSIPILLNKKTKKLNLPLEDKFGLLASKTDSVLSKRKLENYNLKKIATVDLNRVPKDSKKHNDRLFRIYYVATKK
jgi:hypothetical protein